jgi:hypothetical protein
MKTSYLQYILVFSFITTPLLKKYAIKGLNPSNGYIVTHLSTVILLLTYLTHILLVYLILVKLNLQIAIFYIAVCYY